MNENKVSTTGDVSDTIVTEYTTTQTSFPSLSVGEKLKVVFGKINKFISDVKNWKTTVDENLETNTAAIDQLNSDLTGEVTIVVGTNDYSSLKRKGNICVAQISIILTEFTPWQEAKIATVSYLPVSGLQRNIVIYDTATGNAINGRLTLNILGEVSLYTTAPIPDSASLKECFTYICQ